MKLEIERCRREIAAIEALIGAGHPDLQGLCLALSDWWAELQMIEKEIDHQRESPPQPMPRRAERFGGEATC